MTTFIVVSSVQNHTYCDNILCICRTLGFDAEETRSFKFEKWASGKDCNHVPNAKFKELSVPPFACAEGSELERYTGTSRGIRCLVNSTCTCAPKRVTIYLMT